MKTLRDINIDNKNVIIRFDYNVPIKEGVILDDTRIVKSLKTLNYALERANRVVILSHLGRIKTNEDIKQNSLKVVCDYLSKLINKKIVFSNYEDFNENDKIIMMENTRIFDIDNNKESNCDLELSKYFASFGEIFIDDAFGVSHRCNASNVGITKFLPSVNGFLMEEEINKLKILDNPTKPFIVIMGGKKVSDKIKVIDKLITKCDKLLIGGALCYTFLKAKNINVGSSFVEEESISYCKELLDKYNDKIVLIFDNYISKDKVVDINNMKDNYVGYDIGNKTIEIFKKELQDSNTVFFNGAIGLFEDGYEYGTINLLNILNNLNGKVIIGGGDTVNSVNKYLPNNKFIISTGGGATLEYLWNKELPGILGE